MEHLDFLINIRDTSLKTLEIEKRNLKEWEKVGNTSLVKLTNENIKDLENLIKDFNERIKKEYQ